MAHFSLPLQPFPFPVLAVPHPCKSEAGVLLSCSHLSSNYPWNPKELGGDRGGRGCLDSCLEQAGFVTSCPPPHTHTITPLPFTDMISVRSGGGRPGSGPQLGTGRGTLRLRSRGPATVEDLVSVLAGPHAVHSKWRPLPCTLIGSSTTWLAEGLQALDANPLLPLPSSRTFLG